LIQCLLLQLSGLPCRPAGACASLQYYRLDDYLPADVVQVYREQFGITRDLYNWQVGLKIKPWVCI